MTDLDGTLMGRLTLTSMFPVPYHAVKALKMETLSADEQMLVRKQLDYVHKNEKRIQKAVDRLYRQKYKGYSAAYLENAFDYPEFENFSRAYELKTVGRHLNRFPDEKYLLDFSDVSAQSWYWLMHGSVPCARILLQNQSAIVVEIQSITSSKHLPLESFHHFQLDSGSDVPFTSSPVVLTAWLQNRGIPSWREGLDDYLFSLNQDSPRSLIHLSYGLSLTDTYWLNPAERPMSWEDVNFFDHSFETRSYLDILDQGTLPHPDSLSFVTPNNTTDGALAKTWISTPAGNRLLVKAARPGKELEICCEVLASRIHELLSIPHVTYDFFPSSSSSSVLVSCPAFTSKQIEYVTAYALMKNRYPNFDTMSSDKLYQSYLQQCEAEGLSTIRKEFAMMYLADFLILNTDRHMSNFGLLRDSNSLKFVKPAPVFDSGRTAAVLSLEKMETERLTGSFFREDRYWNLLLEMVLTEIKEPVSYPEQQLLQILAEWKQDVTIRFSAHPDWPFIEKKLSVYAALVTLQIQKAGSLLSACSLKSSD